MSAPVFVAGGALLVSAGGLFCFMPLRGAGAGECARRRSNFLLLRQKKVTKEKATPLSASLRFASGNLRCSRPAGSRSNSLRCASLGPLLWAQAPCAGRSLFGVERSDDPNGCLAVHPLLAAPAAGRLRGALRNSLRACGAPLKQPQRVSSRSACVLRHTRHPARCAPRRIQRGWGTDIHTGHRFARPRFTGASASRCADWVERSEDPCGCSAVLGCPPPVAAPAAGRLWGGMGVEAPMHRDLTRRGCLCGAAQQKSEFHGAPRNRPGAGLPLRTAKGSQTWGRLSFGYFSLAKQRKVPRPPGRTPGSRPWQRHAAKRMATNQDTIKLVAASAYLVSARAIKHIKTQRPVP